LKDCIVAGAASVDSVCGLDAGAMILLSLTA